MYFSAFSHTHPLRDIRDLFLASYCFTQRYTYRGLLDTDVDLIMIRALKCFKSESRFLDEFAVDHIYLRRAFPEDNPNYGERCFTFHTEGPFVN